jgi:hypothetical protein
MLTVERVGGVPPPGLVDFHGGIVKIGQPARCRRDIPLARVRRPTAGAEMGVDINVTLD